MVTLQQVKELFIIRDERLHWRDTGVLAGYLTTACAAGRRVKPYPWVLIDERVYVVHRLMRLHEDGELPEKEAPDFVEVAHINGIPTDNNRWNLKPLPKTEHARMDAERIKREKEWGVYHKPKSKPARLDPSDERVRGVVMKIAEYRRWAWLARMVRELFIMRDSRLHWRDTGVEAGYMSVPPDIRERQRDYPYVCFDGEKMLVHRVMSLHETRPVA